MSCDLTVFNYIVRFGISTLNSCHRQLVSINFRMFFFRVDFQSSPREDGLRCKNRYFTQLHLGILKRTMQHLLVTFFWCPWKNSDSHPINMDFSLWEAFIHAMFLGFKLALTSKKVALFHPRWSESRLLKPLGPIFHHRLKRIGIPKPTISDNSHPTIFQRDLFHKYNYLLSLRESTILKTNPWIQRPPTRSYHPYQFRGRTVTTFKHTSTGPTW